MTPTKETTPVHEIAVPVRDQVLIVQVPKDSRLEQLLCIEDITRTRHEAAKAAFDELKDGILAELMRLYPAEDIQSYEIPAGQMWRAMAYTYQEQDFLPAAKIKEHLPPVYDAFKSKKKFWRLDRRGKRG